MPSGKVWFCGRCAGSGGPEGSEGLGFQFTSQYSVCMHGTNTQTRASRPASAGRHTYPSSFLDNPTPNPIPNPTTRIRITMAMTTNLLHPPRFVICRFPLRAPKSSPLGPLTSLKSCKSSPPGYSGVLSPWEPYVGGKPRWNIRWRGRLWARGGRRGGWSGAMVSVFSDMAPRRGGAWE